MIFVFIYFSSFLALITWFPKISECFICTAPQPYIIACLISYFCFCFNKIGQVWKCMAKYKRMDQLDYLLLLYLLVRIWGISTVTLSLLFLRSFKNIPKTEWLNYYDNSLTPRRGDTKFQSTVWHTARSSLMWTCAIHTFEERSNVTHDHSQICPQRLKVY